MDGWGSIIRKFPFSTVLPPPESPELGTCNGITLCYHPSMRLLRCISPADFIGSVLLLTCGLESLMAQRNALEVDQVLVLSTSGSVASLSAGGEKTVLKFSPQTDGKAPQQAKQVAGSTLGTGIKSKAVVMIPSVGTIVLGPETQMQLPKTGEPGNSLELLKGQLFLNLSVEALGKQKKEFRLKTPTALLAVKGTRFFVNSSNGIDTAGVSQGSIEVFEEITERSVILEDGKAVAVKSGQIGIPRSLTTAERSLDKLMMEEAAKSLGISPKIPSGALKFGDSYYYFYREAVTWTKASDRAKALGGHLATLTSQEEYQWFLSVLPAGTQFVSLGGQLSDGDKWEWVTGEEWKFTAWGVSGTGSEEPNGRGPDRKLEFSNAYFPPPGGWNDAYDGESAEINLDGRAFLVEWDSNTSMERKQPN